VSINWLEIYPVDAKRIGSDYRDRKLSVHTTTRKRKGSKRGGRGKVARKR
jgi:hypothetical protein